LTDKEYVVKYALIYLGMKKIKDESLTKLMDDNDSPIKDFFGHASFLCVVKETDQKAKFYTSMPAASEIKGTKAVIIVKAREEPDSDEGGFPTGIANEVVFMEINKPVLENLYNIS
jgi:hypothetical protein